MIKNGLIVVLILLSIFLFVGRMPNKTITKTQIDTVTVVEKFEKFTKGDKIPFKVLDTIYKQNYDTTYILQDYQQTKEFTDTILQDSNTYVIRDTISQNKIIGRSFQAKIQKTSIIITNYIEPKNKALIYLGFRSDISSDYTKVNHNITLSLKTRQKGLFSVGYGMSGYSIGYSLKL